MEVKDRELFSDKLKGYQLVDVSTLKAGDHFRYVRKAYNSDTYKCVYAVIDSNDNDQDISCHGYVPTGSSDAPHSWVITKKSVPFMRFYKKV